MTKNGQQGLTRILSVVFFIISMIFVYRSFYGMRIGAEQGRAVATVNAPRSLVYRKQKTAPTRGGFFLRPAIIVPGCCSRTRQLSSWCGRSRLIFRSVLPCG